MTVVRSNSGNASVPYLLDVTLTATNAAAFSAIFDQGHINAFRGTADYNNDALYMADIKTPVPELVRTR